MPPMTLRQRMWTSVLFGLVTGVAYWLITASSDDETLGSAAILAIPFAVIVGLLWFAWRTLADRRRTP